MRCRKSRVLYVNLEVDRKSFKQRFADVYNALSEVTGLKRTNAGAVSAWNLRGKTEPLHKLLPKLVRRCINNGIEVVIIDPVYKVMTGDENSAADMSAFANQFDALCEAAGVSVIYCHHHSKGFQSGKRSIDRASGSGVFGRDPDAILDMIELDADSRKNAHVNMSVCAACERAAAAYGHAAEWDALDENVKNVDANALAAVAEFIPSDDVIALSEQRKSKLASTDALTAWRIEATLREFPKTKPVDAWFDWPLFIVDESLRGCSEIGSDASQQPSKPAKGKGKQKEDESEKKRRCAEINAALSTAVARCEEDGVAPTRENVRTRMPEVGGKQPTKNNINNWTRADKDWTEWRTGAVDPTSKKGERIIERKGGDEW